MYKRQKKSYTTIQLTIPESEPDLQQRHAGRGTAWDQLPEGDTRLLKIYTALADHPVVLATRREEARRAPEGSYWSGLSLWIAPAEPRKEGRWIEGPYGNAENEDDAELYLLSLRYRHREVLKVLGPFRSQWQQIQWELLRPLWRNALEQLDQVGGDTTKLVGQHLGLPVRCFSALGTAPHQYPGPAFLCGMRLVDLNPQDRAVVCRRLGSTLGVPGQLAQYQNRLEELDSLLPKEGPNPKDIDAVTVPVGHSGVSAEYARKWRGDPVVGPALEVLIQEMNSISTSGTLVVQCGLGPDPRQMGDSPRVGGTPTSIGAHWADEVPTGWMKGWIVRGTVTSGRDLEWSVGRLVNNRRRHSTLRELEEEFGGDWTGENSPLLHQKERVRTGFRKHKESRTILQHGYFAVSYTHLTLPTNREV